MQKLDTPIKTCKSVFTGNLLFISPVGWFSLRQRHQALAEGLAKLGWNVTYIDPLQGGSWSYAEDIPTLRLRRIAIKVPFRAAKSFTLQKIAVRFAWHRLSSLGIVPNSTVCWISDPAFAEITKLNWRFVIYDRCDRHGAFPGQNSVTWQRYENLIYNHADVVLASSPLLAEEAVCGGASNVILVPNAVDSDRLFKSPVKRAAGPPWKLVSAGAHFEWVDYNWLEKLALTPDVELHLAGTGRGKRWQKLVNGPNVVWHGVLAHDALFNLFDSSHIGLVPFCDDKLVLGVDPIKVYEYSARGLAVWAPEVEVFKRHPLVTRTLSADKAPLYLASDASNVPVSKIPGTWEDRLAKICGVFQKAEIV